jgi:hypothetical protein
MGLRQVPQWADGLQMPITHNHHIVRRKADTQDDANAAEHIPVLRMGEGRMENQ